MTQAEKLAAMRAHIAECARCTAARDPRLASFRVNDFCDLGRVLFAEYQQFAEIKSIEVLDEETSARVIQKIVHWKASAA